MNELAKSALIRENPRILLMLGRDSLEAAEHKGCVYHPVTQLRLALQKELKAAGLGQSRETATAFSTYNPCYTRKKELNQFIPGDGDTRPHG